MDSEQAAAKAKQEALAREIEIVKKEYEEKQRRKKEKEKEKKADDEPKNSDKKSKKSDKESDSGAKSLEKERDEKVEMALLPLQMEWLRRFADVDRLSPSRSPLRRQRRMTRLVFSLCTSMPIPKPDTKLTTSSLI